MPKKSKKASWTNLNSNVRQAAKPELRRLTWITTAAGSTSTRVGTDSVTSAAEWSSYSARFTECRVLRVKLNIVPYTLAAAAGNSLLLVGTDRGGALAAALTPAQVAQLDAVKVFNPNNTSIEPMVYQAGAVDLEDQLFVPVGSASTTKNYAVHVANQATQGQNILVEFLVEFKGHQ